jgi:dTDP-4-amino-4,6-dideoxygalactose transaminase
VQYDKEYFDSKEFQELLGSYETAVRVGDYPFMDADDLIDIADYYNMVDEHDKAVEVVDHALELYPHATLPNVFMARESLLNGDYDAAHRFGVEVNGRSVLEYGDISTLSFHATKVFNTIEGGAMVMHDAATKQRIDYLKNFGFESETEVIAPGINSKMDEVRAAYGLLNLRQIDAAIEARHRVAIRYREALRPVEGIRFFDDMPGVRHNYSYFPIFVDAEKYGMTRDELFNKLREHGILSRRYFYPLISTFSTYRGLPSATVENLPNATRIANEVICLPMHHELSEGDVDSVLQLIVK